MSLAHLTLATGDVDATTEFFIDIMRWQELPVPANVEIKVRWLDIGNGGQVHILEVPNFSVSEFEAEYGRHFAFFASAILLNDTKERLRSRGITLIEPIRPTPFERVFFKDPNDYMIEVINRNEWVLRSEVLSAVQNGGAGVVSRRLDLGRTMELPCELARWGR